MKRSEHPINWKRAIVAYVGAYAVCAAIGYALETFVLDPLNTPEWLLFVIGAVIFYVGVFVIARPLLRPWYQPCPEQVERENWTEDKL